MNQDQKSPEKLLLEVIALMKATTPPQVVPGWIPKRKLMEFLDYEETKMWELINSREFVVSNIGTRKFIKLESFLEFMERNATN